MFILDADAFFYHVSPPITDLISKYKKEIIFSEDDNKLNPPAINTGVAIFKNTKRVINILKKWAYSNELKDKYCGLVITDGYLCPKTNWIEDQALVRGYLLEDMKRDTRSLRNILTYLTKKDTKYNLFYD